MRIEVKDLSYSYGESKALKNPALSGVSLTIEEGEFFGIIGHTGSGKSTFVQHLNGLIKPQKGCGSVTVGDFNLTDKKCDFNALRSRVGMVFQYPEYQLFAETVFEDVAFGVKNFMPEKTEQEIEIMVKDALETVGLNYERIKDVSPFELSGGQKRRVAIAGVIVTKPEILVLDEPAAGLDPLGKEEIMRLLHDIHAKWCKTVIIVSHDMDEIAENCTKAAVFSGGKVIASGTPKEIFASQQLVEEMGLDTPFTAKLTYALAKQGVVISSDLSRLDFIKKLLEYAKTAGAGTDITGGGANV